MKPSVCIVGGCGHIGLPLGIALAEAGARVTLLDIDEARVREVAAGRMPFLERGADQVLPAVLATGRLQATSASEVIRDHDTVIVTIGTPVDEFMDPRRARVRSRDRSGARSDARWATPHPAEHGFPRSHESPRSTGAGARASDRYSLGERKSPTIPRTLIVFGGRSTGRVVRGELWH